MAWQVKVKYTKTDGIATESIGEEVKNLFNQYKQDGYILNQSRETVDANTKVDTIVFLSEQKYNDYREAIVNAIGNDETKFSSHTVEVIEQKEVIWG